MQKEIIQIGDERLLQESELIEKNKISTGDVQELAKDLVDTYKANIEKGVGLSAVQIGVLKKMFVVKRIDKATTENIDDASIDFEVMINPEVTIINESKSMEWEGCLSISSNNLRLFGPVERPTGVKVSYLDLMGKKKELEATGFFSHLIQHELDHTNGTLFLSYIDNPKNIWNEKELDDFLEENGRFPDIVIS